MQPERKLSKSKILKEKSLNRFKVTKSEFKKADQLLNDDIKIQTANVKKLEYKRGDPNISNTVCEKKMEKIIPSKKLDKHPRDERQNVTKEKCKIYLRKLVLAHLTGKNPKLS